MLFRIRKYIALLSLAVFLFPQVLNVMHELEHRNDFHCSEKLTKHFHESAHHCNICDFVPIVTGNVVFSDHSSFCTFSSGINYSCLPPGQTVAAPGYYLLLRGPPVL